MLDFALLQIRRGRIETGEIRLEPHWNTDYAQLIADYIKEQEEKQLGDAS